MCIRDRRHVIPNHMTDIDPCQIKEISNSPSLAARSVIVKKTNPLPIEAIVRGYLVGSGWKEYCDTGTICGIKLPDGLELASRLPQNLFTASTKAELGQHDMNISFDEVVKILGSKTANTVREAALTIYHEATKHAHSKDIIIADTKLEFGMDENGNLILIDEVLTPDSSRFWNTGSYQVGIYPPSLDKQFVRDYLESIGWDKTLPAPPLPDEIINQTAKKYRDIKTLLIGT